MTSLALLSFIAGILTILAPCVLPVLPVILAGSVGEKGKWYPYIITFSLALSITLFTIILKVSTLFIDIPFSFWKYLSGGILIFLGLTYVFPHVWARVSTAFGGSRASVSLDKAQNIESSTLRAIVTGAALGPVFSTCSPTYSLLLATVFPVSFLSGVAYTFIYSIGLALMLLLIVHGGRSIIVKFRVFADESGWFRRGLGILFLLIGLMIISGLDKKIEIVILEHFDLSAIENRLIDSFVPKKEVSAPRIPQIGQSSGTMEVSKAGISPTVTSTSGTMTPIMTSVAPPFPLSVKIPYDAPEIALTEWINSNPLTMKALKGKVVIIDFWTYSCINCQRTLPYLTAWDRKYRDQGLVIIGVHAPEFAFEKQRTNVEQAVKDAGIAYPVVLDNDFSLWNAYENQYWPAKYFIDRDGKVRHTHFGEGAYAESEKVIQYLLSEGQKIAVSSDIVAVTPPSISNVLQSPETYLGSSRRMNFSTEKILPKNNWSLSGDWKVEPDSITSASGTSLQYHFTARDVYLVMAGKGTVGVKADGKIQFPGKDVKDGNIIINSDRMYHLVHADSGSVDGILELKFSPGVQAFAFTFGS